MYPNILGVTVGFDTATAAVVQSEDDGDIVISVSLMELGEVVLDVPLTVCISVEDDKSGMCECSKYNYRVTFEGWPECIGVSKGVRRVLQHPPVRLNKIAASRDNMQISLTMFVALVQ